MKKNLTCKNFQEHIDFCPDGQPTIYSSLNSPLPKDINDLCWISVYFTDLENAMDSMASSTNPKESVLQFTYENWRETGSEKLLEKMCNPLDFDRKNTERSFLYFIWSDIHNRWIEIRLKCESEFRKTIVPLTKKISKAEKKFFKEIEEILKKFGEDTDES